MCFPLFTAISSQHPLTLFLCSSGGLSFPAGHCWALGDGTGCFSLEFGEAEGEAALPVERGSLPGVEGITELSHQVVLAGQAEDSLLSHAVLPDEFSAFLHQDGHLVLPQLLLVGHGVCQGLPKHRWGQGTGQSSAWVMLQGSAFTKVKQS